MVVLTFPMEYLVRRHTARHLFDCDAKPTSLSVKDLWEDPVAVISFLKTLPSFSFLLPPEQPQSPPSPARTSPRSLVVASLYVTFVTWGYNNNCPSMDASKNRQAALPLKSLSALVQKPPKRLRAKMTQVPLSGNGRSALRIMIPFLNKFSS